MKSLLKPIKKKNNQLRRFVCMFFAVNCLIEHPLKVACVGMEETIRNRSRREEFRITIGWADLHHIYVPVAIGSGAQLFNLVLDTHFDPTWVVSEHASSPEWARRRRFDTGKSTTFHQLHERDFHSHHVQSTIRGNRAENTIKIAGLAIPRFPFRLITHLPDTTTFPDNMDGVLGLSYGAHTNGTDRSLPDMLRLETRNTEPIFGIKLCPTVGLLSIGKLCTDCIPAGKRLHYMVMKPRANQWVVTLTTITIDKHIWRNNPGDAYFYTGCGWIQGPDDLIDQLNKRLGFKTKVNDIYYSASGQPGKLYDVRFSIDRRAMLLKGQDYYRTDSRGNYSVFRSTGVRGGSWMLGLPVFRGSYFAFDKGKKEISFVNHVC